MCHGDLALMKNSAYMFCICSHEGKCLHKRRFSNEESGLLFLKMVSPETECLHFEYDVHIAKTVGNIIPSSSEAQCLHFFARSWRIMPAKKSILLWRTVSTGLEFALRTIFTHFWAGVSHVHVYACLRNAHRLTSHSQGAWPNRKALCTVLIDQRHAWIKSPILFMCRPKSERSLS